MKKIEKAKPWEETVQIMRASLDLLDDAAKKDTMKKIAALERAIALRDSLNGSAGKIAFNDELC